MTTIFEDIEALQGAQEKLERRLDANTLDLSLLRGAVAGLSGGRGSGIDFNDPSNILNLAWGNSKIQYPSKTSANTYDDITVFNNPDVVFEAGKWYEVFLDAGVDFYRNNEDVGAEKTYSTYFKMGVAGHALAFTGWSRIGNFYYYSQDVYNRGTINTAGTKYCYTKSNRLQFHGYLKSISDSKTLQVRMQLLCREQGISSYLQNMYFVVQGAVSVLKLGGQ